MTSAVMVWVTIDRAMTDSEIMVVVPIEREHSCADEPRTIVIRGISRSIAGRYHVRGYGRDRCVILFQQVLDNVVADAGCAQPLYAFGVQDEVELAIPQKGHYRLIRNIALCQQDYVVEADRTLLRKRGCGIEHAACRQGGANG